MVEQSVAIRGFLAHYVPISHVSLFTNMLKKPQLNMRPVGFAAKVPVNCYASPHHSLLTLWNNVLAESKLKQHCIICVCELIHSASMAVSQIKKALVIKPAQAFGL
jgi:hypothetical protein